MAHNIFHDLSINASIQEVYEAITTPSHLINWWPLKCSGIPQLEEAYNFYFTDEYDWFAKVIRANSPNSFHLKMTTSDEDWDPTSFGFDLKEVDGKVRLSFWHKGWVNCNHHFKRTSYCWALLLSGLKNYVEKGIILPFEERA